MLTLGTRVKVLAFAVISVLTLGFIGLFYADLGKLVGLRGHYIVKLELAETGGLFPDANVTYRGVSVGRVGEMSLTQSGLVADLKIDNSEQRIPANLRAVVANLSAVGEQYVDLRPDTDAGPYLKEGSVIAQRSSSTPPPVTALLTDVNKLASSVPLDALRTLIDELGKAFEGQGPNLQILLDYQSRFIEAADESYEPTIQLIVDGEAVLRTQNEESTALLAFARNARLLARQLHDSDADLRRLIATTPGAAGQLAALLRDLDPGLSVLIANLLTTSDLTLTRVNGMQELLVRLPQVIAAGSTVARSGKVDFGLVTTFFNPLPCSRGYEDTTYRNGLETSLGPPLNTAAQCTLPPSSGVNVRGSANAPRGGVPEPARPGSLGVNAAVALPGALGLPALPDDPAGPPDMSRLLWLS